MALERVYAFNPDRKDKYNEDQKVIGENGEDTIFKQR